MHKTLTLFCFAMFFSQSVFAEENIRVMGLGIFPCEYWHAKVFRKATNHKAVSKEATIFPYKSFDEMQNDTDGKKAFDEAIDWISGYFASAQRFSKKSALNSKQTSDKIVLKVFNICQVNPKKTFEKATHEAMSEFLK